MKGIPRTVIVLFLLIAIFSSSFAQVKNDSASAAKNAGKQKGEIQPAPVHTSANNIREFKDSLVNNTSVPKLDAGSHDESPAFSDIDRKPFSKDPFLISKKKMPTGNDFKNLVPPSACLWKRIYYKDPTPMFDGEARYTNGKDTVFMLFSLQKDVASRNSVFQTIKNESIEADNLIAKEEPPANPAWLKVGKGQHVFFAWTRNNYIFSCESLQGWNAINAFMKCFPY
jgi:hypothetical protein